MFNDTELLKLLLPEYLINHFDIVKFEEKDQVLGQSIIMGKSIIYAALSYRSFRTSYKSVRRSFMMRTDP